MPSTSVPAAVGASGARRTHAELGGGVKLRSGTWKHGPESPVGVFSLWTMCFVIIDEIFPIKSHKS